MIEQSFILRRKKIEEFTKIIISIGEEISLISLMKNELHKEIQQGYMTPLSLDFDKSFRQLIKDDELNGIAYDLLSHNINQENEIIFSHQEVLAVLENSIEVQIVKFTEIADMVKIIQDINSSKLKGIVLKFTVNPNYPNINLAEITNGVQTETDILMGLTNDTKVEELEVTALFIL